MKPRVSTRGPLNPTPRASPWPGHIQPSLVKPCSPGAPTHLDDIQASSPGAPHVDCDRLYQSTLGKVLNLLRHGGTEE